MNLKHKSPFFSGPPVYLNLIVLMFGGVGEWGPVIVLVLGLHPKANGELQQVRHKPVQQHIVQSLC